MQRAGDAAALAADLYLPGGGGIGLVIEQGQVAIALRAGHGACAHLDHGRAGYLDGALPGATALEEEQALPILHQAARRTLGFSSGAALRSLLAHRGSLSLAKRGHSE